MVITPDISGRGSCVAGPSQLRKPAPTPSSSHHRKQAATKVDKGQRLRQTPKLNRSAAAAVPPNKLLQAGVILHAAAADTAKHGEESSLRMAAAVAACGGLPTSREQLRDLPSSRRWRTPCSWFQFPPEIRNQIYKDMLRLPTTAELYTLFYKDQQAAARRLVEESSEWVVVDNESGEPTASSPLSSLVTLKTKFQTPAILLVCRAITAECAPFLRSQPFVIDRVPPWIHGHSRPMRIEHFIGRRTLQSLEHIEIRVELGRGEKSSGWIWLKILEDLLGVLAQWNSFSELRVVVKLFRLQDYMIWRVEQNSYASLKALVARFHENNRQVFRPGTVELEHWEVLHDGVYKVDTNTDNFEKVCKIRDLPNTDFIPGSIADFLLDTPSCKQTC